MVTRLYLDNDGTVTETYPKDYATRGGLTLTENQENKFFHKGGDDWTSSAVQ